MDHASTTFNVHAYIYLVSNTHLISVPLENNGVLYNGIGKNETKEKTFYIPQSYEIRVEIFIQSGTLILSEVNITFNGNVHRFTEFDNDDIPGENTVGFFNAGTAAALSYLPGPTTRVYTGIVSS